MRTTLAALALLATAPQAHAALIGGGPGYFDFSSGWSHVSGVTADGRPWTIDYYTSERVDRLWWTPCSPCASDDGTPGSTASPVVPGNTPESSPLTPTVTSDVPTTVDLPPVISLPPEVLTPTTPSPVPLPTPLGLMGLALSALGCLRAVRRVLG